MERPRPSRRHPKSRRTWMGISPSTCSFEFEKVIIRANKILITKLRSTRVSLGPYLKVL